MVETLIDVIYKETIIRQDVYLIIDSVCCEYVMPFCFI